MTWRRFGLGFIGAIVNSVSTAVVAFLTGLAVDGTTGQIAWEKLGVVCLVNAILGAALYLREHREIWTDEQRAAYVAANGGTA